MRSLGPRALLAALLAAPLAVTAFAPAARAQSVVAPRPAEPLPRIGEAVPERAVPAVVRALLFRRHGPDPGAETWRRLGQDVDQHLASYARDPEQMNAVRFRALQALANLGGPLARKVLLDVLANRENNPDLLASALESYAAGFGAAEPEAALGALAAHLGHADPLVRRAAVRGLSFVPHPAAREALLGQRAREKHAAVRRALTEALGE